MTASSTLETAPQTHQMDASGRRHDDARPRSRSRPWLFLLPAAVLYTSFVLWPTYRMFELSLFSWDGVRPRRFTGALNYQQLVADPLFWSSFQNNALWIGAALVVPVFLGLALAILLARTRVMGRIFFRTVFFLPQVLSTVVVAVIWGWIYNPSFGALNTTVRALGLDALAQPWLGSRTFALPALLVAWSWVHYGLAMVIFLAALANIDETYFDAAKVDGANGLQRFWHILLPAIRGPFTTVALITAVSAFQIFDLVFVLTQGGPGRATTVLAFFMFQGAFYFQRVGYGAAIAVVLTAIILVMTLVLLRVRRAFDDEAGP